MPTFCDGLHFPRQLYIREGRRLVGLDRLTEGHINPYIAGDGIRPPLRRDAIAVADWMMESQACVDETPDGYPYPEGFLFARVTQAPFQVPYGCLLPRGIDSLLAPGCLSATHVAFSAVRCEAARIQTGTAAEVAAALALDLGCGPAAVPVAAIQEQLIQQSVALTYFTDVGAGHPAFAAIQWAALRGFVPADRNLAFRPDHLASWADLAEAAVRCMDLPISVTGAHFETIQPDHSAFRYVESLYDLGTRAGVEVFDMRSVWVEDSMRDFIRVNRAPKRIALSADAPIGENQAQMVLDRIVAAITGAAADYADVLPENWLTRGRMCGLLRTAQSRIESHRAPGRSGETT